MGELARAFAAELRAGALQSGQLGWHLPAPAARRGGPRLETEFHLSKRKPSNSTFAAC